MKEYIIPDLQVRDLIEGHVHAESNLCYTCCSCSAECPVNLAANCLDPRKVVRLAALGGMDELLTMPEIWYCVTCRRCSQVCPMKVKPSELFDYCRKEAFYRKIVSHETVRAYRKIFFEFQQIRWHMAAKCLTETRESETALSWNDWLEIPIPDLIGKISSMDLFLGSEAFKRSAAESGISSCFTCGECGNICPVSFERRGFNPVCIFRMANMGLAEALLTSPSIWLCIGCQRCTESCTQLVKGHLMIRRLQELAVEEGAVDRAFPYRLKHAEKMIYPLFLDKIDELFGFPTSDRRSQYACHEHEKHLKIENPQH